MPVTLEHISEGDWGAVQRLVDRLQGLLIDTGGLSLRLRGGSVTAAGAVGVGTGFSVTKNATGDYSVTVGFASIPAVVVGTGPTSGALEAKLHQTTPPSATGFRVLSFNTTTGAAADCEFHWVAIG